MRLFVLGEAGNSGWLPDQQRTHGLGEVLLPSAGHLPARLSNLVSGEVACTLGERKMKKCGGGEAATVHDATRSRCAVAMSMYHETVMLS